MEGLDKERSEAGFTLLETVVSLGVITVVLAFSLSFFSSTQRTVSDQGRRQVAAQLALDGVERARGLKGSALLAGRAQCVASCPSAATAVAAYLTDTERWDNPAASGTPTLPRPGDAAETTALGGISYRRYWYVGKCWQAVGGGACRATSDSVPLVRVVVAVTWPGQHCAQQVCSHVTSALFAANASEPIFDVGTL